MTYRSNWMLSLRQASWRGTPFFVDGSTVTGKRRTVVHSYPYRDNPWIEDLGRANQEVEIRGFVNSQLGTAFEARDTLRSLAMDRGGVGELVHPSLGSVQAVLIDFSSTEDKELGGIVVLEFRFILTPNVVYTSTADFQSALGSAAQGADGSFLGTIRSGISAVRDVQQTVVGYVQQAQAVVGDATRSIGAIAGLDRIIGANTIGCFLNGPLGTVNAALSGVSGVVNTVDRASIGINAGLSAATGARTAVINGVDGLQKLAGKL